jgi:DNA-binding PadR family transcriptional regulator
MEKPSDIGSDLLRGSTPSLVLAVLHEGPAHGYAIAKRINKAAESPLQLKQGTLYPVLHGLERDGFVTGEWEHPEGERPRKVYAITPSGNAELVRRTNEWKRFAASVNTVLGVKFETV